MVMVISGVHPEVLVWPLGGGPGPTSPAHGSVVGRGFDGRGWVLVLEGVALEQGAVREGTVTHGAGEVAPRAHVHVQRTLLCEAFTAHATLERSHTCVHYHVLQQVITQREGTPADTALMGLLTGVYEHVLAVVLA